MTISKVRLDSVFTDPFGKSASDIMSYLIRTDPEEVSNEKILSFVRYGVKASPEEILDSIHGYEFLGEHGIDPETIRTVKTQYSQAGQAGEEMQDSKSKKADRKSNLNPRPKQRPQNRNLQKGGGDLPSPRWRKASPPLSLRQLQLENIFNFNFRSSLKYA